MGYLLAKFFFEGSSSVWIPKIGIRESGDVTFYAGRAFALPDNGLAAEAGEVESKVQTRPPGHQASHQLYSQLDHDTCSGAGTWNPYHRVVQ